ncbi:MAG: radical SAM protein [Methanogenium sp.]
MYLQITTKCNMRCAHCCYSCGKHGKHMEYTTAVDAISFARNYDDECISIGGGEPTLHPRFFDILRFCIQDFSFVWMATNGSKTKIMRRLANIILEEDYPEGLNFEDEEAYDAALEAHNPIFQSGQLTVALSTDYFHRPIDEKITNLWKHLAKNHRQGFETRDVTLSTAGVAAAGRAVKTGSGWGKHCVCSDLIIRPDGKIKLCGCSGSPIIGDIWSGIEENWKKAIRNSKKYSDERCYKALKRGKK